MIRCLVLVHSKAGDQETRCEPLAGRVIYHPASDLGGDRRGVALGLAGFDGGEATFEAGAEPPLDGAWRNAEVDGDFPVLAAPMGQADDLEVIEEVEAVIVFPTG